MPTIRANTHARTFRSQTMGTVTFHKRGKLRTVGAFENPVQLLDAPYAARFFVGFKVGNKTKWTMKSVEKIVWDERKKQGRSSGASFLAQEGIYEKHGKRVSEPSCQILIFDFDGLSREAFLKDMILLGETLRQRLQQEEVILEIQKQGLVESTYSIT